MSSRKRQLLLQRLAKSRGLCVSDQDIQANKSLATHKVIPSILTVDPVPLSYAQERMWFLHQLDPSSSAYNVCVLWQLRGNLNEEALKQSAIRISIRHGIFRTVYNTDDGGNAVQTCLSHLPPQWQSVNLRDFEPEVRAAKLHDIAQRASTEPFDLSVKSSLRLVLVALSDHHHVLVMVGQHISWDGPSFGIFSRELADGYGLHLGQTVLDNSPSHTQYIDFAQWHRQRWETQSSERDAALNFWQQQLSPLPEPLDLPTDFERRVGNDESGSWFTESLDRYTTQALAALCAQEKVTPFEILVTTIAILMTRLARSGEITIGTVASHRNLPELDDIIGNFGNVVPLRLRVSTDYSFRRQLRCCAEVCRSAFSNSDIPFEHLLDHLNITRGEASNPLLDIMVTFLNHGMDAPAMHGIEVQWQKHFNGTTQTDLSFDALLQDGCLQLQATWRTSLYRPETIPKHLQRLSQLLKAFVTAPETVIAGKSVLLSNEYEQLVNDWGYRPALPPQAPTMVECFENTVREHPHAIAVIQTYRAALDGGTEADTGLDFTQLNQRANRLARWLVARGIGPGHNVAICLPRRTTWFVAMLASLKAGAAFVAIDPDYPRDYKRRVMQLAKPSTVFIDELSVSEIDANPSQKENAIDYVHLNYAEKAALDARYSHDNLSDPERLQKLRPTDPVYIVFTSGSSGEPKGVVVPHSALVNLLSSHREDLYKEAVKRTGKQHLRVGHAWSLSFDAAWQPGLWMFEGHELHIFDTDIMRDPIALAREVIQRKLDFIELTPSMLEAVLPWLESGISDSDGQFIEGHLPAILGFGGEPVKGSLWQRLTHLANTTGFNLYGPTETTVDAMIARAIPDALPSIGGPVAGAQAYVLDTCLQLAPPGIPGELAIAGCGLARGYLGRGDLTASQFIANPYGPTSSRLYRTGDRVRWLPWGSMEYIGRIDEQIKIRGFRVEPLEVEASIERLIERPCAVIARHHSSAVQLLCFFEVDSDEPSSAKETNAIKQRCADSLPSHLVPKYIISIKRFPRLPNGKIDRRSLPIPKCVNDIAKQPPTTALEYQLCQLFADVLGLREVGVDEGFFELGGDSISIVKLVSRARREGVILTARQIFDARSVDRLAAQLQNRSVVVAPASPPLIHDTQDAGFAPVTPLMKKYLSSGTPLDGFAQLARIPLPIELCTSDLEILLTALVQHHALLRARLNTNQVGTHCLDIPQVSTEHPVDQSPGYLSVQVCQLRHNQFKSNYKQSDVEPLKTPAALAKQLCDRLDPAQGIMIAAVHVNALSESAALWLAVHHLVIDASSWHVLAGDLAIARSQQERGESICLPPVPTAWRSWSIALEQSAEGKRSQYDIAIKSRGTLAESTTKTWIVTQPQDVCPVALLAQEMGVPFTSLLAVLMAVAAMRAGIVASAHHGSLSVSVEHHGREPNATDQDLSRTIGWFADEIVVPLSGLNTSRQNCGTQIASLRHCCWHIARAKPGNTEHNRAATTVDNDWLIGFNFLGELTVGDTEVWMPGYCLNLIVDACGAHWPLLHDLNVNAYYERSNGTRHLRIDALGPACAVKPQDLDNLFIAFEAITGELLDIVTHQLDIQPIIASYGKKTKIKEMTPLQHEMLRQCQGESDPWTTQTELSLCSTERHTIEEASLKRSVYHLLARHQALRAGFLIKSAKTFIASHIEPDWHYQDWSDIPEEKQQPLLCKLREAWHSRVFELDHPPLIRFMLVRLSQLRYLLLINCHHLLLDGWSVPRLLHELLGNAIGVSNKKPVALSWCAYLDWLEQQDQLSSWLFWNRELHSLDAPSLLCPDRKQVAPSHELVDSIDESQHAVLIAGAKQMAISPAVAYQLAWARMLADYLNKSDIVFGLFDSGRAAQLDGIESLVGLTVQLIPIRIETAPNDSVSEQLKALQARHFEWQTLAPVKLERLDAAYRFGEFFDTLLVIENALTADTEIKSSSFQTAAVQSSLSLINEQRWRDSIGYSIGLFVYPGRELKLRLCYDPVCVKKPVARQIFLAFKQHLFKVLDQIKINTKPNSVSMDDLFQAGSSLISGAVSLTNQLPHFEHGDEL